ncbi:MAG TPA: tyrosine-type recombinase/integrase [Pseudonocardiaceae bacterium]|nr:tyrosine-type recombinase/integrase [Pseudonocardiaceae bacterium]
MGSVEKRARRLPDGSPGPVRWRARYRDVHGRTRSRTFTRKLDAERFLERNGTELQRGEWIDPSVRRTSFNEWADAWWPTTSKLRPNTRRGYWLLQQNHVLPYFGSCQLGAIDYLDVERFITDKLRDGHGAKQVREMVTVISLIMQCAIRTNARRDNPARGHLLRLPKHRAQQVSMLTMEQAHSLVEHTTEHYRPAMWLLIFTGMRPAELCGLRVEDVDLVRRVIHIRNTWSPIPGFDGGVRQYVSGPVKTDAGQRSIPIPRWLCDEMAAALAARSPVGRLEPLIVNKHGRPVNRDTFRAKVVRPALRAAGLPTVSAPTTSATPMPACFDSGANVLVVAQRMGHTDPSLTLRVYGHLFDGVQEELTEALDRRREAAAGRATGQVIGLPRRGRKNAGGEP